jgi:hypothetical protein
MGGDTYAVWVSNYNHAPSATIDLAVSKAEPYTALSMDLNQYVAYFDSMDCSPQNLMTVIASGTPAAAYEKLE